MQVTQEKILEYLKRNFLGLSKNSNAEEIYMYEFLYENDLMSKTHKDNLTINNEGQDFIRNANYFNPVPMTVNEWVENITNQLKNGEKILNGSGKLFNQARNELKQDHVIEQVGRSYLDTLTSKGRQFVESGLPYREFLKNLNNPYIINAGGHVFNNSPISDTKLNASVNSPENKTIINNQGKGKTSILEKLYWIAGIILALIAVYEFYLKYHLTWK
jgi:hypothetical protein